MAEEDRREQRLRALKGFLTEGEAKEHETWDYVDEVQRECERRAIDLAAFCYRLLVAGGILPGRY
jgi:hypothetical protein